MPEPERGTTAWLRALAERLWQIDYDLRCIGEIDRDNLTLEEERYVDSLLAEIHQMSAPPEDEPDRLEFDHLVPSRTYEAVVVGRRKAPPLILDDDTQPAEQVKRISYDGLYLDDVAITGTFFRMEQMDKGAWWIAIYRGDERTMFSLRWDKRRRDIVATITEDSIPPAERPREDGR